MKRLYEQIIRWHLANDQQMIFLAGPRQVGKTTIAEACQSLTDSFIYLNWDRTAHRQLIIQGVEAVADHARLSEPTEKIPIIVFDEIHKYRKWKNFLKGFYDTFKGRTHIIVTGSAKLDIYQKGSDSLLGRYFPYRVHPISVAECLRQEFTDKLAQSPEKISDELFNTLWEFGGFPEPFIKRNQRFHKRWIIGRRERLFTEEIRTLTQIQEIDQMEVFAQMVKLQVGDLLNRSEFSKKINVAVTTIKRWLTTLERFYYVFSIKPWTKNVARSLIKEPKIYLWDWSELEDVGKRAENFIGSHLFKAVHYWQDSGLGAFQLYFVRDKDKREVDFLVAKDNKPWLLVEAKYSDNQRVSESLHRFQQLLKVPHAVQVVIDKPYVNVDCFAHQHPVIVSARTFLSQLV